METECEKFRDSCSNDVCGMRRVSGQRTKESELRNEEVCRAVAEKRRAFEKWLQRRDRVYLLQIPVQKVVVKRAVQNEWRTGDGESDWGMISRATKRCFGKSKASEERGGGKG